MTIFRPAAILTAMETVKSESQIYLPLLRDRIIPLWLKDTFNSSAGLFAENLDLQGHSVGEERRSMVQARQIYCSFILKEMGLAQDLHVNALRSAAICAERCQQPNGSYVQAISLSGEVSNPEPVLYAQAFALFGLAIAYKMSGYATFKADALKLVNYLRTERALPEGGFTEMIGGKTLFQSNPHMHLFEAVIEWLTVDQDQVWKDLADELYGLCRDKFFVGADGALCEHFDAGWVPQRNELGAFIWEPGHHYEWAWLLGRYSKLRGVDIGDFASRLFSSAEKYGVDPKSNFVMDEIWCDRKVKKSSSRVWPQCERTKAAAALSVSGKPEERAQMARIADGALKCVLDYLKTEKTGLWFEYIDDKGQFRYHNDNVAKASSLYHILGAISEHYFSKQAKV